MRSGFFFVEYSLLYYIYISPKTLEMKREFCYNYIVRCIINKCCLRCCK